jgi:hypothetical protein
VEGVRWKSGSFFIFGNSWLIKFGHFKWKQQPDKNTNGNFRLRKLPFTFEFPEGFSWCQTTVIVAGQSERLHQPFRLNLTPFRPTCYSWLSGCPFGLSFQKNLSGRSSAPDDRWLLLRTSSDTNSTGYPKTSCWFAWTVWTEILHNFSNFAVQCWNELLTVDFLIVKPWKRTFGFDFNFYRMQIRRPVRSEIRSG